ncbi:MAG: hypothetical protein VSS52_012255, partial [Thiotrichaceae bacterium]|nr:hypothetical protein [Thiotrichaceae bacterium]
SQISLTEKNKTQLRFLMTNKFQNLNSLKSCDPDLIWIAALLNEMGYLSLQQSLNKFTFQKALNQFQKDIGKSSQLNMDTWKSLSTIKLTSKTKEYINHLRCK